MLSPLLLVDTSAQPHAMLAGRPAGLPIIFSVSTSFPHCHIQLRLTLLPGPEVTLAAGTPASNSGRDFRLDKKPASQTELLPPTQAETPAWQETMLDNRSLGPNSRGDHLLNHRSHKPGEREETETKEQISIQQRKPRNQDLGL